MSARAAMCRDVPPDATIGDVPLIPPPDVAPTPVVSPDKPDKPPGPIRTVASLGRTVGMLLAIPIALYTASDFVDWEGVLHFAKNHPSTQLTTGEKAQATLLQMTQEQATPELKIEADKLPAQLRQRLATAFGNLAAGIANTRIRTPAAASGELGKQLDAALGPDREKCQEFVEVWGQILHSQTGGMPTVMKFSQLTSQLLQGR